MWEIRNFPVFENSTFSDICSCQRKFLIFFWELQIFGILFLWGKVAFLDKFRIVIIFENSKFSKFSEFPDDRSYGSWKGLFSEKTFSEQVRIEISEISMFPGVRTGYLENCQ